MNKELTSLSKALSLFLRHQPEKIGLLLDAQGWTPVNTLLEKMNQAGIVIDEPTLHYIVENNNKKRFAFNENHTMIRAHQGHSITIDLDLAPIIPPPILYHGTADRFLDSILQNGLLKQNRHHVHLTASIETARNTGSRHGKPVLLQVDARAMHQNGHLFYVSANEVWLTEQVPAEHLKVVSGKW